MTDKDALDILAADDQTSGAHDPKPEDALPTSIAPVPGTGVSA